MDSMKLRASKRGRLPLLRITREVLQAIKDTIGSRPAETGGFLGGRYEDGIVTDFFFDDHATSTGATYSPNTEDVNAMLADWNSRGVRLLGGVHSHPGRYGVPSRGDLVYAESILRANPDLPHLFLPIVLTRPDTGAFELKCYVVLRYGRGVRAVNTQVRIVDVDLRATYSRVETAYNLHRTANTRLVAVGVGGASLFVKDMARAGVGQYVFIDPDVVSESNIGTQDVYRRDIDRPKVEALAEQVRDINPNAVVVTRQQRLDALTDEEMNQLVFGELQGRSPHVSLLCGMTDDFATQARVNRLSLDLGVPSLCAQVYREGRGAEVTFTYPGKTPACHRCVLSARYEAQELDPGSTITSDGTPIFATTRLNALKGFIAMALIHAEDPSPRKTRRFSSLLERIGNRNLVQLRLDPDIAEALGLDVFDRVLANGDSKRLLFDDTVWLPQIEDGKRSGRSACPDCGGTGNLLDSRGMFTDTRVANGRKMS